MPWILSTLYIAIPAFAANIAPVVAARWRWLPFLNKPINAHYLGANKTWRGLVVGVVAATVVALVQYLVYMPYVFDFPFACLFGIYAGLGALFGDAFKSFIKRAIAIAPGKPFIPFDYIDYIIGMCIFTYPIYPWSVSQILFLLAFACIANPATNSAGYYLGIKKTYW